ncbi:hypothetical protein [Roseateles asaccharophilus]|uniref:Uncharacterized protein n=1 Tax=Roseateles asaccharophilus TaxID=582607 RepID=A0ABU2AAU0_9BURK|nr:hypothetical protein [Roseateles asaccharophilus]MDR7334284.1 hypothetical protein [Roseateles asaccharophilus]
MNFEYFDDGCHHNLGDINTNGYVFVASQDENISSSELESAAYEADARRFCADLKTIRRISMLPVTFLTGHHVVACIRVTTASRTYSLYTNDFGDSLLDESHYTLFFKRNFSLFRYDLQTPQGRAAAREYVRRKLKFLAQHGKPFDGY